MFDGRWRDTVDRGTGPVGRKLQQVGITADVLTATGLISAAATAVAVAHRPPPPGHRPAHPDRPPRPARRTGGQGLRHLVGPRGVLRLGDRPGVRRPDPRRRRLVPGVDPPRPPGAAALRRPRRHLPGLLPAGQGRVARHLGQGRADGAGRADDPARHRLPLAVVPGAGALGDAGPDLATAVGRFAKVWRLAEAPGRRSPRPAPRTRTGARTGRARPAAARTSAVAVPLAGPSPG